MAADSTTLFIPGHGTVFVADPETPMPTGGLDAFGLTTAPTGWVSLGHTSTQNTIGFNIDGGDATNLGTWLQDNVRTIYAETNWTFTVNELQMDQQSLDLAFNGWFNEDNSYVVPGSNNGLAKALFVLCQDGTGKLGFHIPNTSAKLGDSPVVDTANFFELPVSASIQSSSLLVGPDGRSGIIAIYKDGLTAPAQS